VRKLRTLYFTFELEIQLQALVHSHTGIIGSYQNFVGISRDKLQEEARTMPEFFRTYDEVEHSNKGNLSQMVKQLKATQDVYDATLIVHLSFTSRPVIFLPRDFLDWASFTSICPSSCSFCPAKAKIFPGQAIDLTC
jgi:hypothetical protein